MNTPPAPIAKVLKKKTVLPSGAVFLAIRYHEYLK
jgi:hypothetical protein